jgi:sirohydrochlorin ferrochelatase
MSSELLLLVGRDTPDTRDVLETYANELLSREAIDDVAVETYDHEPYRELNDRLAEVQADSVYAIPMFADHTYDTTEELPAALSVIPGDVQYGDILGESRAVTSVLNQRAEAAVTADSEASLVLVGLGSNSVDHETTEYHAQRLRDQTNYDEVLTCYLMQNPALECVRYNISNERSVAVPMFLGHNEATDEQIPNTLEVDRGGIEYAEPLGVHERITEALHAEIEKLRVLAASDDPVPETKITRDHRPLAADGEGR